ncbi:O-antigen ligase family protein [Aminipila sp.]|uniref:O-antigen ligase family protein n=1 Tax=Aminipila sp. TaxID=2060095 RepID=UPI0028A06773|nr:O-antigen ligase family protein [Aminipila sp.]
MAKINKQGSKAVDSKQNPKNKISAKPITLKKNTDYSYAMSMAPRINDDMHWLQLAPAIFFTTFIIMIVRLHQYQRPMNQFYWTNSGNNLVDFFSYYKMVAIIICTVFALVFLLYRIFSQSFFIKRTSYYMPMIIYMILVLSSHLMSDYKDFALLGWNDRFEGTITLLSYMVMLFFVINSVNTEKNIKLIIYSTVCSSIVLSLLGVSQALNHDLFKTTFGKKLITPSWFWNQLNNLTFNFKNKEIYQTVYNINYVSFYLTLLIPLFGLLFIRSVMSGKKESLWKQIFWGALFSLNMYNLIGSQSSGGFLGMAVVVLIAIILLNKTILKWWKPVAVLLVITVLVGSITYERWMPELSGAAHSVLGIENKIPQDQSVTLDSSISSLPTDSSTKGYIDYIETKGNNIILSYEGNEVTFTTYPENPLAVKITDSAGNDIDITKIENSKASFTLNDARFKAFIIGPAQDTAGINYFIVKIDDFEWDFAIIKGQDIKYRNTLGNLVSLNKVEHIGWKNNQDFGSGRGYIWSRTIPMMKETVFIGHGADTYCLYFPHNDYVGKYNAGWSSMNLIVDKPHNMYMGAWIGTGGLSVLSLLVLWFMYIFQCIKLFWKRKPDTFTEYAGLGIFLGICGFLVSGLVDDSTVSVMPMFYGLLGTGIAINIILKKQIIKVD